MSRIGTGGALGLALALSLPGCADPPAAAPATAAPAVAAPPRAVFRAKVLIPVRLTLHATEDGGRAAPVSGGYRPDVTFAGSAAAQPCGINTRGLGEFGPGQTRDVGLRCSATVTLAPGARGFTVSEAGREVGSGVVLP